MGDSAIRISSVTVVYGRETVLDLPRLDFEKNKIHVLVGGNGAGKTTLLRVVAGLEQPTTGTVQVLGRDLARLSSRKRLQEMRRMTICFQKPHLFAASVRSNIGYGLRARGLGGAETSERVLEAMETLGLAEFQDRDARTLSAGETHRVSLARALVLRPELVLLDEPVANVDTANKARVEAAVMGLQAKGSTVVVATHEVGQALRLSANVVRLEQGRIGPQAIENLLEGEVVDRGGSLLLAIGEELAIRVVGVGRGLVRAAVDPASIIVSREKLDSSARNCLPGKIVALEETASRVVLTADVGVRLKAYVTRESFERLALTLGSDVYLVFKASSVAMF